jgi:hypothetical protein
MIDFQSIFRDPRWQRVRFKGTAPHSLYVKQADDGKVAVLVALRTRANGDWTLSKGALEFMVSRSARDVLSKLISYSWTMRGLWLLPLVPAKSRCASATQRLALGRGVISIG